MVPLDQTTLRIAGNIISHVNSGARIIARGWKLYASEHGVLIPDSDLENDTKSLVSLTDQVSRIIENARIVDTNDALAETLLDLCAGCKETAGKLLTILKRWRNSGKHQRRESVRAARNSAWQRDEIESLTEAINCQRMRLIMAMMNRFKAEVSEKKALVENRASPALIELLDTTDVRCDPARLLYCGAILAHRGDIAHFSSFLNTVAVEQTTDLQLAFLKQLECFISSDEYDNVKTPHNATFHWVYPKGDEMPAQSTTFPQWLQGSHRLYWIGGKHHSGKTTLMRYIYDHAQTRKILESWADTLPLVMTRSFVSTSDSPQSKMKSAMLASLLYTALLQQPGLVPFVFPARWRDFVTSVAGSIPWTNNELLTAFKLLVQEDNRSLRLCCFVDGLDWNNSDHTEVVKFWEDILSLSEFKLCVSSQCSILFEDAFRRYQHLRLENLTSVDIEAYVVAQMRSSQRFVEYMEISPSQAQASIDEILSQASGNFAWVTATVTTFIRMLSDGYRSHNLLRCIQRIPHDLEALHKDTFNRLNSRYRDEASFLFKLIELSSQQLSLLQLSFCFEDPDYILRMPVKSLDSKEKQQRCESMRRFLSSRSNGLLELSLPGAKFNLPQDNRHFFTNASSVNSLIMPYCGQHGPLSTEIHRQMGATGEPLNEYASQDIESYKANLMRRAHVNNDLSADGTREYACFLLTKTSRWQLSKDDARTLEKVAPTGVEFDYTRPGGVPSQARTEIESILNDLNHHLLDTRDFTASGQATGFHSPSWWHVSDIEQVYRYGTDDTEARTFAAHRQTDSFHTKYKSSRMWRIKKDEHSATIDYNSDQFDPFSRAAVASEDLPMNFNAMKATCPEYSTNGAENSFYGVADLRITLVRDLSARSVQRRACEDSTDSSVCCDTDEGDATCSEAGTQIRLPHDEYRRKPKARDISKSKSSQALLEDYFIVYSHFTVNDFLKLPKVSAILDMTTISCDMYEVLSQSCLAMLKTISNSQRSRSSIVRIIGQCLLYASKADSSRHHNITSILHELDEICQKLLQPYIPKSRAMPTKSATGYGRSTRASRLGQIKKRRSKHWISIGEHSPPGANFLCLSIQLSFFDYVRNILPSLKTMFDGANESLLLYTISPRALLSAFVDEQLSALIPNVDMARCLFEHGADPNEGRSGTAPWDEVLLQARKASLPSKNRNATPQGHKNTTEEAHSARMEAWAQMVELFLNYGANPLRTSDGNVASAIHEIFGAWDPHRALQMKKLASSRALRWRFSRTYLKSLARRL